VVFIPADLDRRFGRDNLPDHGNLLANLVRWAAKDNIPLVVEGAGLIDCQIYQQKGRMILHLVNLTSAGTWRQPVDEHIPVGPLKIQIKLPEEMKGSNVSLLVSGEKFQGRMENGWIQFEIRSILNHEVAVVS
jgi:hypothetical protein